MTEQKALIKHQVPTLQTWQVIENIAPALYKARLFGVSNPEQAMAIMLKGYEIGLGLTAAFEFIQVIGGRPSLSPRGCLALVQRDPACKRIMIEDKRDKDGNPTACRVTMERNNGFSYTVEFTMGDARRAGLVKEHGGWEKYPANMLRWRAVGFCADVVFPDVIGGLKRADELGADLTPEGDVLEGEYKPTEALQAAPELAPEPKQTKTLDDLLSLYEPSDIMTANGGKIPATDAEIGHVWEVLSNG